MPLNRKVAHAMLNRHQRDKLIGIVQDLTELHDSLPSTCLIPEELARLFDSMPELCEAMAVYTMMCDAPMPPESLRS